MRTGARIPTMTMRGFWAELMQALKADAKMLAVSVPRGKGKLVLAVLKMRYGSSSAARFCQGVTTFVNSSRSNGMTIQEHNTRWGEELRQLHGQGVPLPAMFQCYLYLLSFGPAHNMFQSVAAMSSEGEFKLEIRLVAKANDFTQRLDHDEAGSSGKAMMGGQAMWSDGGRSNANGGRSDDPIRIAYQSKLTCFSCGKAGHKSWECRAPGGGRSSQLTPEEQKLVDGHRDKRRKTAVDPVVDQQALVAQGDS
jgi:hypothetical protein